MSVEDKKAIVRRYVSEVWGLRNMAAVDELFAPTYVDHVALHANTIGRDGLKRNLAIFYSAFPDAVVTAEAVIAEGDKVVWRWVMCGTHLGEFQGISPTGKHVEWTGIIIWRVTGREVVEWWAKSDTLGLLQQIGAKTSLR